MLDRIIISSDFEVNDINFHHCIKGMKSDNVFVVGLTDRQMSDICMSKIYHTWISYVILILKSLVMHSK